MQKENKTVLHRPFIYYDTKLFVFAYLISGSLIQYNTQDFNGRACNFLFVEHNDLNIGGANGNIHAKSTMPSTLMHYKWRRYRAMIESP